MKIGKNDKAYVKAPKKKAQYKQGSCKPSSNVASAKKGFTSVGQRRDWVTLGSPPNGWCLMEDPCRNG